MTASFENNSDGFGELVSMYVSEMPGRVAALRAACENNDRDRLTRLLHQLVGSAGSYGFDAISREARRVELVLANNVSETEIALELEIIIAMCQSAQSDVS